MGNVVPHKSDIFPLPPFLVYLGTMFLPELNEIVNKIYHIINAYTHHPPNLFLHQLNESWSHLRKKYLDYTQICMKYPKSIHAISNTGLVKCREIMLQLVCNAQVAPISREHYIQLSYLHTLFYKNISTVDVKDKLKQLPTF